MHREEYGSISFGRSKILQALTCLVGLWYKAASLWALGIFRSPCLTITAQKWVALVNVNKAILNMRIED